MSGGVGQIRSAGKGGPEVVAPVGNRPERSEGIIRFRNFWFVKFRERAIRWIFGGVRPPWAETTRAKNSPGGGADLDAFFVYGNLKEDL